MCNKVKKFCSHIRAWLSSRDNREITTSIVAIIALIVAIISLMRTTSQVGIARADLEARTRPYLSIENIQIGDRDEGWISINITINNLGEIPATGVQFGEVSVDGEQIAGNSQPDEHYPARTYTTEDGVTITITERLVVTPIYSGLPYDMIFFPQKPTTIEMLVCGSISRSRITDGSVMNIGLTYFWGDKQYEYVATAVMSDGEWRVILERGD